MKDCQLHGAPGDRRARRAASLFVVLAALLVAAVGCKGDDLDEDERREIRRIVQTGIDLDDPFVQTETLRVIELVGDPELASEAEDLARGESPPMVAVAALRVLLEADNDEARRLTKVRFNRADQDEKLAILRVVADTEPGPLRREITTRGLRSEYGLVRKEAFEVGLLARLRQAKKEGDESYLKNTLYPELGRYISTDDPVVSAVALRALVDSGEEDRAEPLLDRLADERGSDEERRAAAKILGQARVEAAAPDFKKILEEVDVSDKGRFHIPEAIDEDLVRAATLGLISIGEEEYANQAQRYLNDADSSREAIEVIEAVANNDSEEAAIMLEVTTQDARRPVRYRAIELLADHERARAADFVSAMRDADLPTRNRLADVLVERFPDDYSELIGEALDDKNYRKGTLEMLLETTGTEDRITVLEPLEAPLEELARSDDQELSAPAKVLLVKIDPDPKRHEAMAEVDDPHAWYAYLEHLAVHHPQDNLEVFREHLYSDHFALQLISGAGLLRAFEQTDGEGDKDSEASQEE